MASYKVNYLRRAYNYVNGSRGQLNGVQLNSDARNHSSLRSAVSETMKSQHTNKLLTALDDKKNQHTSTERNNLYNAIGNHDYALTRIRRAINYALQEESQGGTCR